MNTFWNRSFVKRSYCTAFVLVLSVFAVASAHAQTDVNINAFGAFPGTATGPATVTGQPLKQTADPSLGFRIGARHVFSPLFGLEINYGYSRAVQHFTGDPSQTGPVYAHAKPFSIDYVATFPTFHGFKPFALGGAALVTYNISSFSAIPARLERLPAGEYGVGADYRPAMFPRYLGFRFQYRGLVEHAPDFRLPYLQTNNLINIAEPSVGLYFKF
ncbi:MAG TPA: hypothetical protein VHX63_06965 [Acidobacteriaceae bacterium]|nr:hypothetical protein [Acidobacteriaceae bacterium]